MISRLLPLVALCAATAVAQDVSVGPLAWFSADPAPDEMPKQHGRLNPAVPPEMRATDEIGYVIVVRSVSEAGKSVWLTATGTHTPLQRAVESEFTDWTLSPARRAKAKVFTRVWLPVIFNPKSASPSGSNATPRLLQVTPVLTPTKPVTGGGAPVVRARLGIDATGAVTDVEVLTKVSSKNAAAIQAAVRQWKFAPARQADLAIQAEITMGIVCQTAPKTESHESTPARVLEKVSAEYPLALKRFGLSGNVTIGFDVDAAGHAVHFAIVESDNPAFDEPAIRALRQWKFQPAMQNGQPVDSHHLPVTIHMNSSGGEPFQIAKQRDQSKLPPEMRYDTPPKIKGVLLPVYPYALRREGISGKARVGMLISPAGRVVGVKVLDASNPEFGDALAAAVAGWHFDPAYRDGKPVPHLLTFEQSFSPYDLPDEEAGSLLSLEKAHPDRIAAAAALDQTPTAIVRREPVLLPGTPAGEAVIECVIDQEGRVHLPRVKTASDAVIGAAALQAASAWWFEPATIDHRPVIARIEIPFKVQATPRI